MDKFQSIFLEEAVELISDLEDGLLLLEKDPENKDPIEKVFRSMHTLKGSSNMFGFEQISSLTHDLENIYDKIRNGDQPLTKPILDVTLESIDHLRNLLGDLSQDDQGIQEHHQVLLGRIRGLLEMEKGSSQVTPNSLPSSGKTFLIDFKPNREIFKTGNNLLYLIDEIHEIGEVEVQVNPDEIPDFEELKADLCYLSWRILLYTEHPEEKIKDIFIFILDQCELSIQEIFQGNAFREEPLRPYLENFRKTGLLDLEDFKRSVQKLASKNTNELSERVRRLKENKETTVASPAAKKTEKSAKSSGQESTGSIRVPSDKLDKLMNMVSELVTTQARLSLFAENENQTELSAIAEEVEKISRQLRDNAFSMSLVPLETLVTRFRRLVRDVGSEINKDVRLDVMGGDTELDKSIIEHLTDPLLHILRNCMDHGIESSEERARKGKPDQGIIQLKSYYSGVHVVIEISDDGAGIDTDKVYNKALEKGLIEQEATLSHSEIVNLVMLPGFSTAEKVTGLSGRGVGMDVVSRKIAEIRGEVSLDSQKDKGTRITIKLPLTLSIIDGLLVDIHDTKYIIPLSAVDKIYDINRKQIEGTFTNYITLDGVKIPFHNLREEFEVKEPGPDIIQMILVEYEGHRVGITVDNVIGEYQAVLKPLGKFYRNVEIISGATILGDGMIALVLDTNKIIKISANEVNHQVTMS